MKQQIEQLIDRLADKTLSFGCKVSLYSGEHKLESVLCEHNKGEWKKVGSKRDSFKVLGHPILIGDVLERVPSITPEDFSGYEAPGYGLDLVRLWGRCGFSDSLQSIFDRAEWEEKEILRMTFGSGHEEVLMGLVPKQKEIRSLFELLLTLKI